MTESIVIPPSGKGGVVDLCGVIMNGIRVDHKEYTEEDPLILDGHGEAVICGFKDPDNYDPRDPLQRTWGNVMIQDSKNVVVRNLTVLGGIEQGISILDSYPEVGLRNVTIENVTVKYPQTRGVFMGGHNMQGLKFKGVRVFENVYDGASTHAMYLSGGCFDPSYPAIKDVTVEGCIFAVTLGRHGLQINGRFEGVRILDNLFAFNQLCGVSLIGCKQVRMEGNRFFGNGRSAVVLYDYIDESYWDLSSKESMGKWYKCHHPNGDITIRNNTMVMGPEPWIKDYWHFNDPKQHPVILINNPVHGMQLFDGLKLVYPPGPTVIKKNILSGIEPVMVDYRQVDCALLSEVDKNMFHASLEKTIPLVSIEGQIKSVPVINDLTKGKNVYKISPEISVPSYPMADLTKEPKYDFGSFTETASKTSLFSGPGKMYGFGADALKMRGEMDK